ncbi:nucleotidyltransferase family protein [Brucella sp. H1_1004]|uniref:nucleotidyltransferase family protein n=1 Tax=Brucella sp. H1_1004 TaxID=3110109 RepID=UPI0039B611F6
MIFSEEEFVEYVMRNDRNRYLLDTLPALRLPQCTLTAGCLFQTVWNIKSGNKPDWAIKDYDIFYFDASDLSWEAEDAVIQKARSLLGNMGESIEIRNQARVHLWYQQKFNSPCPVLTCVEDGIDRFLIEGSKFGINLETGSVYAPIGFDDMWKGVLRINPNNPHRDLFISKCQTYRSRWPWLSIFS